jgi:protein tyrosine phosphatase (PTP) superfamily phosphohydrolase (DUF442 family)
MDDLPHILNWRRYSALITTSGQPTEDQLAEIKDNGVTNIINLGPHHNKGALADEAGSVSSLGMTYNYIPVEFDNPTDQDFAKFSEALDQHKNEAIHIHCIYNARVSAFFYRFAKETGQISENRAFTIMDGIWRPGNDWSNFIGSDEAVDQPNRYSGEDY